MIKKDITTSTEKKLIIVSNLYGYERMVKSSFGYPHFYFKKFDGPVILTEPNRNDSKPFEGLLRVAPGNQDSIGGYTYVEYFTGMPIVGANRTVIVTKQKADTHNIPAGFALIDGRLEKLNLYQSAERDPDYLEIESTISPHNFLSIVGDLEIYYSKLRGFLEQSKIVFEAMLDTYGYSAGKRAVTDDHAAILTLEKFKEGKIKNP